jgi:hypothetical protein
MRLLILGLAMATTCLAAADQPPAASAATWHLVAQVYSLHEHTTRAELTNSTPGLAVMRRTPEHWLAGGGVFRNSLGRTAGYAFVGKQWELGPVYVGGIGGVTHRYNYNNGGPVPLAALSITVPVHRDWAVELLGIPRIRDYTYTTLHFAVSWRFR